MRLALTVPRLGGGEHGRLGELQHVAFASDDALAAARRMRERGVPLLAIPGNYYDDLAARTELGDECSRSFASSACSTSRRRGGELLHFFTEMVGGRLFFEVVERRDSYDGYGARQLARAAVGAARRWRGPAGRRSRRGERTDEHESTMEEQAPGPGRTATRQEMVRDLPEPPRLRKLIGPSVILVGVGVASGEYILYPYIASKAGLVFLWAAVLGVAVQFFINMEIERYTLATGQTAITGFQRLWKPFGLILVLMALLATVWPGWATSAATVATFAFGGGDVDTIAIGALLAIGVTLTASPVVYQTVERLEFLKVGALLVFIVIALFAAVSSTAYSDTTQTVTSFGTFPSEVDLAILVGALAAAGAGGANNLVQSNWIRDKGFGMGRYAPRIVSPITGEEEAALSGQRYSFPQDEENMSRWHVWWKRANLEQFLSFAVIATVSIRPSR